MVKSQQFQKLYSVGSTPTQATTTVWRNWQTRNKKLFSKECGFESLSGHTF